MPPQEEDDDDETKYLIRWFQIPDQIIIPHVPTSNQTTTELLTPAVHDLATSNQTTTGLLTSAVHDSPTYSTATSELVDPAAKLINTSSAGTELSLGTFLMGAACGAVVCFLLFKLRK